MSVNRLNFKSIVYTDSKQLGGDSHSIKELQWAQEQMFQTGSTRYFDSYGPTEEEEKEELPIPEGAVKGAHKNIVWESAKADLDFNGDPRTQDIWSKDVTLNVFSLSATVYAEKTRDPGLQAPTDLLRIIVQDQGTGQLSVYLIHNCMDAHVTINTPTGAINQDSSGGLVTVGTYCEEETHEH